MGATVELDAERLSARHHFERRRAETEQQRSYAGLETARRAAGVARIVMGVHLASLHDSGAWRGRTGASSFRRFLLEEGIEPSAAYQYMTVARAFVLEHAVAPELLALVGMRVLVEATKYLRGDDPMRGIESNVDDVVAIVTSLPAAEAHRALAETYEAAALAPARATPLTRSVHRILSAVDTLTHDERADLYLALRAGSAPAARPAAANEISETTGT